MTITDPKQGSKALLSRIPADVLVLLVLILATTLAFGIGVLVGKDMGQGKGNDAFWIEQLPEGVVLPSGGPAAVLEAVASAAAEAAPSGSGTYVASKNGTKYYLPSCGSSKRIKEENKVWFATKEAAEAAGYGPAANCPGL